MTQPSRTFLRAGRHGWPFVPLAPLAVFAVGLAVALALGWLGLADLKRVTRERAAARVELLGETFAARLEGLPVDKMIEATRLAVRSSGIEILLVGEGDQVTVDATLGRPSPANLAELLRQGRGLVTTRSGASRFVVEPIGPDTRAVVFVAEPPVEGVAPLVTSLAALFTLLVGVATVVAYAVSRDLSRDVEYMTGRIARALRLGARHAAEVVPVRTMDPVGALTRAFNQLVHRFSEASEAYQEDLAKAHAADRERAAFLAAISHELRSPLNAILGFADLLVAEVDGPLTASAREEVEQIRGSGEHLRCLVNDIVELSALEIGQLSLSKSRVDLSALAADVVKEARGLIGDKDLTLRIEAAPGVLARVDSRRIRQALGNLVNNAVKFTLRGEVVVRVESGEHVAKLFVRDTGPGISGAERSLIFDEYKQTSSERRRRRGTGLGLAIARRIVLLHRGSISVESDVGVGSTFCLTLPVGNLDVASTVKR